MSEQLFDFPAYKEEIDKLNKTFTDLDQEFNRLKEMGITLELKIDREKFSEWFARFLNK